MSNFTGTKLNANKLKQKTNLTVYIEFCTCEVRRLKRLGPKIL